MKFLWLLFIGSVIVTSCSYLPQESLSALQLQNTLVETTSEIILKPKNGLFNKAIIFYPGGLVDPHVYLSWQDKLVSNFSNLAIITVKMPSNLAVLGANKGLDFLSAFPTVETWIVAGHSLGGTMGASLVASNPNRFKGLIFIASYPADNKLLNWQGAVLSIHASNDGLSTPSDIELHKSELPSPVVLSSPIELISSVQNKTHYFNILGGNHAQFGNYGVQKKDGAATITKEQQQFQLVEAITNWLKVL